MPISVKSLPTVLLDYTKRGPGLHAGLTQLQKMLEAERGREGYIIADVNVPDATIPVVLARSDLYLLGFRSDGKWFRFNDANWPFSETAIELGYNGQYGSLGDLKGNVTTGAISSIAKLASSVNRPHWKEPLRTLLLVVCECSRLIPVRMEVLGLLNGCCKSMSLEQQAHYIQNWGKASKGMDMSQEVTPNLRVGFSDPTIIKR